MGEKGKKQGQIGKKRASGAQRCPGEGERAPPFPFPRSRLTSPADFFSVSPNVEPGPRL